MNNFICANCMHGKKYRDDCEWEYMYDGTDYANDCCDWWRPTNADRIRSMTDEELAEFIRDQIIDRNIGIPTETWLDWLKEEAVSDG